MCKRDSFGKFRKAPYLTGERVSVAGKVTPGGLDHFKIPRGGTIEEATPYEVAGGAVFVYTVELDDGAFVCCTQNLLREFEKVPT